MYEKNIAEIIGDYNNIIISPHIKPDGDAIGSSLATAILLKSLGKNPIVLLDSFNSKFDILPGMEFIYSGNVDEIDYDVFIALDCGSKERLGEHTQLFEKAKIKINIDHHISNNLFGDYNFVNVKSSSTCEMVFNVFNNIVNINKDAATCIYLGIIFDTGGFRNLATKPETMIIASQLMEMGVDFSSVFTDIMYTRTIEEIKSFAQGLTNLKVDFENEIAYTYLTMKELSDCNATLKDIDGIVSYILNIKGVSISIFIYEKSENIVKVSLRSKYLDVNKVAANFGGGGHINAAGCDLNDTIENAHKKVKEIILKELKNNV